MTNRILSRTSLRLHKVKFDESRKKKLTLLSSTCTKEKWVCTPQNIHIPRSEVSLSSVFCCNAFSLHYYASESENRIACYPICPMGRKLLYYSPPTSFCSVLFGERKNKISMTKIEFPFRYTCFSFLSARQTHFYFSHFKTQKNDVAYNNKVFRKWAKMSHLF